MMLNITRVAILVALSAVGAVGCSSTSERGPAQSAGANAGRVIDDSVITGKVKTALIADSTTKAYQIDVDTYQGTVQLSGFVDSSAARERAEEIAKDVEGVKKVKNSLALRTAQR